jgi:hypothetical protein
MEKDGMVYGLPGNKMVNGVSSTIEPELTEGGY